MLCGVLFQCVAAYTILLGRRVLVCGREGEEGEELHMVRCVVWFQCVAVYTILLRCSQYCLDQDQELIITR